LLLAAMAGGALVDQMYFRAIRATLPREYRGALTSQVADALLLLVLPVLIAGGIAVSYSTGRARALYVASLAVFSLEFLLPLFAGAVPSGGAYLQMVGPFLRVLVLSGALLLAFMGTREVVR
jgi:hypothetical protein